MTQYTHCKGKNQPRVFGNLKRVEYFAYLFGREIPHEKPYKKQANRKEYAKSEDVAEIIFQSFFLNYAVVAVGKNNSRLEFAGF